MEFTAEQYNVVDEPARFFILTATRRGLPVHVFHAFRDQVATMKVRLLGLVPLVDARGVELDRAETVTLFNDLCLLAPGALVHSAIRWEPIDRRSARGHYPLGSNTVSAVLTFNEVGELIDFVSDDRLAVSPDGTRFTRQRWSTPVRDYRQFGPWRVGSRGEGRWHPPEGEFAYVELELLDLETNRCGAEIWAGLRPPLRTGQGFERSRRAADRGDHPAGFAIQGRLIAVENGFMDRRQRPRGVARLAVGPVDQVAVPAPAR